MCTYIIKSQKKHLDLTLWPARDAWYMDAEDPIPYEDRYDAPTLELDAHRIAQRDPEEVIRRNRRQFAGSFHEWMRRTFMEEEAARRIQQFVRPRLSNGTLFKTHTTDTTLSFLSVENEEDPADDESDEHHLQYEVFVWHGSYLGLEFYSCNITGYPCVDDSNGNNSLPGMWNLRQGDYLISINDHSTHQDKMDFEDVVQILEDGVRPAILRFRRPRLHEVKFRSSLSRMSTSRVNDAKKEVQRRRERLEKSLCYVVWREEDGPLGIVLQRDHSKPYPTVSEVNPTGVVARESQSNPVRAGDLLMSINHMDVSGLGYEKSLEIMKFAPRPLVLTFRRSSHDPSAVRSLEL